MIHHVILQHNIRSGPVWTWSGMGGEGPRRTDERDDVEGPVAVESLLVPALWLLQITSTVIITCDKYY